MKRQVRFFLTMTLVFSLFCTNLILFTPITEALITPAYIPPPSGNPPGVLPPTAPSSLASTAKSTTTVDISWSDNSMNETGFKIERKTGSGAYVQIGTAGANVASFKDSGLSAGTQYAYRVRAYNIYMSIFINSAYSNELTVTTNSNASPSLPGQLQPITGGLPGTIIVIVPLAPTGLSSTAKTTSSISLSWTDNSINETGFKIERKTGSGTYSEVGTVAAGVTTYTNSSLTANTAYTFRVRAYNASGNSGYSNELTVTTNSNASPSLPGQLQPITGTLPNTGQLQPITGGLPGTIIATAPFAPTGLSSTAKTTSSISLSWTDNSNNETGFKIERKTGSGTYSEVGTVAAGVTTYTNSSLTANTAYTFRVRAYNASGNSGYSNELTVTTNSNTLPSLPGLPNTRPPIGGLPDTSIATTLFAPTGLSITTSKSSSISLSWTDNSINETGFKIERKTGNGTYSEVGTVAADVTTYTSSSLTEVTTYTFRVRAYKASGNSGYSNEATGATIASPDFIRGGADTILEPPLRLGGIISIPNLTPIGKAPGAPSGLTASANSTVITLKWSDVSNEKGYTVERKTTGGTFAKVGDLAAGATTFIDSGLNPGTKYNYRVKAYNDTGSSGYSNEASATTGTAPASSTKPAAPTNLSVTPSSATEVSITWKDNASNETGYVLECKVEGGDYMEFEPLAADTNGATHPGLTSGITYYYRVKAFNASGDSAYSNAAEVVAGTGFTAATEIPAPSELTATAKSATEIDLTWKNNATTATGFIIESKTEGGEYALLGSVGGDVATCTDQGLLPNTKYYYRISATNEKGNSLYSNEVSTTTLAGEQVGAAEVKLYIGSQSYTVNGKSMQMDVAPISLGGRTLLPARYIAEALGAQVEWVGAESKVVITRGTTIIEMWLNQPLAKVNGIDQYIDPNNAAVKPITVPPGRTMTPGRFIAENLGATVGWDAATQEVTISYTPAK